MKKEKKVSVITKRGGVVLGKLDSKGRLVWVAGRWLPSANPDMLDRELREEVARNLNLI